MTQEEYQSKTQAMGALKLHARLAHERGDYMARNELCRRHDELALEVLRAASSRTGGSK